MPPSHSGCLRASLGTAWGRSTGRRAVLDDVVALGGESGATIACIVNGLPHVRGGERRPRCPSRVHQQVAPRARGRKVSEPSEHAVACGCPTCAGEKAGIPCAHIAGPVHVGSVLRRTPGSTGRASTWGYGPSVTRCCAAPSTGSCGAHGPIPSTAARRVASRHGGRGNAPQPKPRHLPQWGPRFPRP